MNTKSPDPNTQVINTLEHRIVLDSPHRATTKAQFPIRFALAFFALAITTHAFASVFWRWLESQVHSSLLIHLLFSLLALVACVVTAGLLWNMRLETHHRHKTHLGFIMLISTLGAIGVVGTCHDVEQLVTQVISEHGKPDSEAHEIHHLSIIDLLIWLTCTLGCSFWLALEERRLPRRSLSQRLASSSEYSIEHLILPLSVPTSGLVPRVKGGVIEFPVGSGNSISLDGKPGDLNTDISKLNVARHNWQQILRAIEPHQKSLKSIWIFGSNGSFDNGNKPTEELKNIDILQKGGSAVFVADAVDFLKMYLPNVQFHRVIIDSIRGRELSFNNYNDLESTIERILESIHDRFHDASDRSICIDATGGLKLTSVVAAAVTYRRQTSFQYVDTVQDANGNPVHQYDIVFETRPEL